MNRFKQSRTDKLIKIDSVNYNSLSPNWSINFWIYNIFERDFILELGKFLLDEEKLIIEKYPAHKNDGSTGLGLTTTTARFPFFNLFNYKESSMVKLQNIVRTNLADYLKTINFKPNETLYINCWYNVMTPGQEILSHAHGSSAESFLSGHFTVWCEESLTYYDLPFNNGKIGFQNCPGEGTFFPSYITHGTSKHNGERKRITIAFDIYHGLDTVDPLLKNNVVKLFL